MGTCKNRHALDGRDRAPESDAPALYVDLDGTLLRTDLLLESVLAVARNEPLKLLALPGWLLKGPAALKLLAHRNGPVSVATLPYNTALIDYLKQQKLSGRRIYLATAANERLAKRVAAHLGFFDGVIASDARANLKGSAKLNRIVSQQKGEPFAYAGDSDADRPIWAAAAQCVFVNAPQSAIDAATRGAKVEQTLRSDQRSLTAALKAMRPHQWAKNLLIFVPMITAHLYVSPAAILAAAIAFACFCLAASAIYLVNDLLDLQDDRVHPRKKNRPFAAGALSIQAGMLLAPALLALAATIAALGVSVAFTLTLVVYVATSLTYSLWLKRISTIDVFALAGLYTVRVIAGSVAIGVAPTFWLLAFSMFLFLSLAFVKRYVELAQQRDRGGDRLSGRGYSAVDLETTFTLGAVAGGLAVLVMALYINSPEVAVHYRTPEFLWVLCPAVLYWINRVWIGARRGKIHDDPVVFAIKDRVSLAVGLVCLACVAAGHYVAI